MAITSVRQSSFAAGEVSPSFFGRTDFAKFDIALRKCKNWIVGPQGSAYNRPGTQYIAETKTEGEKVRLIPFQFSDGQSYVWEFGNYYARPYVNGVRPTNPAFSVGGAWSAAGGYVKYQSVDYLGYFFVARKETFTGGDAPVPGVNTSDWWSMGPLGGDLEIPTPYATTDLPHLKYAQSGDVITFASQNHVPFTLSRRAGLDGLTGTSIFWGFDKILFGVQRDSPSMSTPAFHHSNEVMDYVAINTVAGDGFNGFLSCLNGGPAPTGTVLQENMKIWGYAVSVVVEGVEYVAMYSNEFYMLPAAAKSNYNATTTPRGQPITVNFNVAWAAANLRVDQFRFYKGRGGPSGTYGLIDIKDGDYQGSAPGVRTWVDDGSLSVDFSITPPQAGAFPGSNCDDLSTIRDAGTAFGIVKGDWYSGISGDNVYEAETTGACFGPPPTHTSGSAWSVDPATGPWYRHEKNTWTVGQYLISNGNVYRCTIAGTLDNTALTTATGLRGGFVTGPDGSATFTWVSKFYGIVRWRWIGHLESVIIGYPGVVTFVDQRLVFANSPNQPAHIWGSQVGNYRNFFEYHRPAIASDPYDFELAYNQYEEIRGFVPAPKAFIAMTSAVEWALTSGAGDSVTATSINAKANSQRGCDWLDPKLIGNAGVFVQNRLARVRELVFDFYTQSYGGNDLSQLSQHLFDGFKIQDWAYSKLPISTLWLVRSDGRLLGLTYIREQEFNAWHWHETNSGMHKFEQICVVSEQDPFAATGVYTDMVYVVVKRGLKRYIERFLPRFLPRNADGTWNTVDGVFSDSSVSYTTGQLSSFGVPVPGGTTVFTGLGHLEGFPVTVLIDGNAYGTFTVASGQVDVTSVCPGGVQYKAIIGLPLYSDMEFLPPKVPGADIKRSNVKLLPRISFEVADSRGETLFGPDYAHLKPWQQRAVKDSYGVTVPFTGLGHVRLTGVGYDHDVTLCVRQVDPLPINLLAIEREIDVGGD